MVPPRRTAGPIAGAVFVVGFAAINIASGILILIVQ